MPEVYLRLSGVTSGTGCQVDTVKVVCSPGNGTHAKGVQSTKMAPNSGAIIILLLLHFMFTISYLLKNNGLKYK